MNTQSITPNDPCNSLTEWAKCQFLSFSEIKSTIPMGWTIQVTTFKDWSEIATDLITLKSEQTDGGSYKHTIELRIGATYQQHIFDRMRNDRFVILLTSAVGLKFVIGTKDQPLNFEWATVNDDNHQPAYTRLTFSGETRHPFHIMT